MRAASKNTIREIIKSKSRFLSIFLICAIGVGFFSGVRATSGIMKTSADDYYDENNLFDLRVVSTFGLTEDDAAAIAEIPDVDGVFTSKYTDLNMRCGDGEFLTRVYSRNSGEINSAVLVEGDFPTADDECMVSYNTLRGGIHIGDKIMLEDISDAEEFPLTRSEYTVTGIYKTPMFISMTQRGNTNIGDGVIDAFIIVPEEHFTQEPFTEIYIKSDKLKDMACYSDEYENLRDEISDKLELLGIDRSAIRYDEVFGEIREVKQQLSESKAQLDGAQAQIDSQEVGLEAAKQQLESLKQAFGEDSPEVTVLKEQISEGEQQITAAQDQVDEGMAQYNAGMSEIYAKEKEIGDAEWYIFTRDDNAGYSEYESNADRIGRIAVVFPVFFLLVAGLVCLTTMSRMVEEQRTQIGTLKALGYSSGAIMKHYMIYAVSGAAVGGTLGAVGGCFLFPGVITYAYSMMYDIKKIHFMFTPDNMIISIGSMIAAIALTVFFSCRKALRETPASLMRPKAPKAGKRVFIEKIPVIWNRLNFFWKVCVRNLFRYKRRMFMTIVGIAGCTALSLTGFGLKNSINDIIELQYNEINRYSGYAAYDEDAKPSEIQSIYDTLLDYNKDTDYTRARIKQYNMENSGNSAQVYITAVENSETFERLIDFRERKSGEKVSLSAGAVITEKAAKLLDVKIGDEVSVRVSDGVFKSVKIGGITEQYTGHYMYLSESVYTEVFGEEPKYNMVYFYNGISRDKNVQDEFTAKMLSNDNVLTVIMNASSLSTISETLQIMDLVTVVLIVSAMALAFVVLYNLTNVNITERIREIATLKVLGFYDIEVSSYVFRENIILSLLGAAVGLGVGYALCMFVITTAELDEMMFGRTIHGLSYLWSFLVTTAFSLIVNLIMTKSLKKISMVESLKSVE